MFRFETIVGIVIVFSSITAFGADADLEKVKKLFGSSDNYLEMLQQYKTDCEPAAAAKKTPTKSCQFLEGRLNRENSNGNGDCDNLNSLKEKVNNLRREFRKTCGPAGFPLKNTSTDIECSAAIERCNNCASSASNDLSGGKCDEDVANDTKEEGFNFERMERVAKYCPALGGKNAKELEKKLENAQKDKKEAEKKLPEVQKKLVDARNKAEDEAGKAMDTMTKAQQNLDQELAEAQKKYSQEKKRIAQEITELQQQIAQADDGIRQLVLSKSDAEMQFNEAIQQINLNCHQSASNTVTKLQADRLSRPFNRGNFQNMMKQVGLSDRQAWQRVAEKYYRYCLKSEATKASKRSAKAAYDSALRKADVGLQKFNEQKLALVQKQMNLKNGVCNPNAQFQPDFTGQAPDESDSCTAAKEALADGQRAQRKYNSEANKAAAEAARADKKGQNEAMVAQAELAQINQQKTDEDKRVRNLRRAYEIADEAADKSGPDPKAHDNAMDKYGEFNAEAAKYVRCAQEKNSCDEFCKSLKAYTEKNDTGENVVKSESSVLEPLATENKIDKAAKPEYYQTPSGEELTEQIKKAIK
jgi:hypothetical protein